MVITLLLNFRAKPWSGPTTLFECFGDNISEEMKPFLNDYKLNVIDIPYITPEQVKLFRSDFRFVADYFVQSWLNRGDYTSSLKGVTHVDETLKLIATLEKDDRSIDVVKKSLKNPQKVSVRKPSAEFYCSRFRGICAFV